MTEEVNREVVRKRDSQTFAIQNQQEIGNASGCHSGTHQVVVVGCPVERGGVTSEVSGETFWVGGGSVQVGLIHWSHPEEVVAEQEKGRE